MRLLNCLINMNSSLINLHFFTSLYKRFVVLLVNYHSKLDEIYKVAVASVLHLELLHCSLKHRSVCSSQETTVLMATQPLSGPKISPWLWKRQRGTLDQSLIQGSCGCGYSDGVCCFMKRLIKLLKTEDVVPKELFW